MEHPSESEDRDGGQFGGADADGRIAERRVAMVDVGLDVVVGRVVVELLHATFGLGALHDVADGALHVLDHLAAVSIFGAAIFWLTVRLLATVLAGFSLSGRDARPALDGGHRGDGEDGGERQGHQQLGRARHL